MPIGYWMHRGGVPFVSPEVFQNIYWATVKPIIEELWADGCQTLFYAEGKWDRHLESFAELPAASIVYHVDQGDIFQTHRVLGEKFCLSGGIPNYLLGIGTPEQVRQYCKKVIEGVAGNGGYVMDAGAIIQNDARVENIRAMTEATREFGVYSAGHSRVATPPPRPVPERTARNRRSSNAPARTAAGCASPGRKNAPRNPRHPRRRGDRPEDLGGHRGPGEHVHLASPGVVSEASLPSPSGRGAGGEGVGWQRRACHGTSRSRDHEHRPRQVQPPRVAAAVCRRGGLRGGGLGLGAAPGRPRLTLVQIGACDWSLEKRCDPRGLRRGQDHRPGRRAGRVLHGAEKEPPRRRKPRRNIAVPPPAAGWPSPRWRWAS